MKNVTTNITIGQIFFILLTVLFSSLMFFYLGAKFGPKMLKLETEYSSVDRPFLPNKAQVKEIEELLINHKHQFVFFDALQSTQPVSHIQDDIKITHQVAEVIKEEKIKEEPVKKVVKQEPEPVKKIEKEPVKIEKTEEKKQVINQAENKSKESLESIEPEDVKTTIQYGLQLGSFSNVKKAKKAKAAWERRGYEASIIKTSIAGKGRWYRLSLGSYDSLDEVLAVQKNIMTNYRQSGRVIKIKR